MRAFTKSCFLATGLAALIGSSSVVHAQSINTVPDWNGTDTIGDFGGNSTSTYGETFTSPGSSLNDFSFYVNTQGGSQVVEAQIYAWSGSLLGGGGGGATGPALFTSTPFTLSNGGMSQVMVETGGVALTAGMNYVALLTIADAGNSTGVDVWGIVSGGHPEVAEGDGGFVFFNNGNDISLLNTEAWDNFRDFGSLAWNADFGPIPEPASFAVLAAGLGGLALMRKSRKGLTA